MKVKIEIECDSWFQVFQHLFVIRRDIKRVMNKQGIKTYSEQMENASEKRLSVSDDNCYGYHIAKINP